MFRFLIHFCYHKGYLLLLNWQIIVYPTDVPKYPAGAFVRTIGSQTSYYTFHGTAATWYDAVETCKRENIHSNLATVVDPAEQNYLVKLIQSDVSKYYLKSVFFLFFSIQIHILSGWNIRFWCRFQNFAFPFDWHVFGSIEPTIFRVKYIN